MDFDEDGVDLFTSQHNGQVMRAATPASENSLAFSMAASMSPWVSSSALLHSIIPAPVRSRNSLTCAAVIWVMLASQRYKKR